MERLPHIMSKICICDCRAVCSPCASGIQSKGTVDYKYMNDTCMCLMALAMLPVNGGLCDSNHSHASSPLLPLSAGLEFPWGPKPFAEVVAGPLLRNNRQTTDSSALEGSYVGVYFSAHWVSLMCVCNVAIVWMQNCWEICAIIVWFHK